MAIIKNENGNLKPIKNNIHPDVLRITHSLDTNITLENYKDAKPVKAAKVPAAKKPKAAKVSKPKAKKSAAKKTAVKEEKPLKGNK